MMNDIDRKDGYQPTSVLAKQGLSAIICGAGGIFLFILQIVSRFRVVGLIAGVAICIVGIFSLKSKDPTDWKPGAVITTAGILCVLSKTGIPFIREISGTLLSIGAVGLLALGIINGIKFLIGLKKRS